MQQLEFKQRRRHRLSCQMVSVTLCALHVLQLWIAFAFNPIDFLSSRVWLFVAFYSLFTYLQFVFFLSGFFSFFLLQFAFNGPKVRLLCLFLTHFVTALRNKKKNIIISFDLTWNEMTKNTDKKRSLLWFLTAHLCAKIRYSFYISYVPMIQSNEII